MKNRSLHICLALALYLALAPFLPAAVHRGLYTASLLLKEALLFILPFTLCFFIAGSIASFQKKAPLFLLSLLLFELASNTTSLYYAYGVGKIGEHFLPFVNHHALSFPPFEPLFSFASLRPAWWTAGKGSAAGAILGLTSALYLPTLQPWIFSWQKKGEFLLTRLFGPLIPLFVLGFTAKMWSMSLLQGIALHYGPLLLFLLLALILYIAFLFGVGSYKKSPSFSASVGNLLPAALISFSSGCSLSTMPWTIAGTEKNLQNKDLAKAVIPATTNIQQVGDLIVNGFLAFLIYLHFHGSSPPLAIWIPFSIVFVLARFATAAVAGGAIFLMLPIYEKFLGFTEEMSAMILAFNVVLDPLITTANVLGNSALCRLFERFFTKAEKITL